MKLDFLTPAHPHFHFHNLLLTLSVFVLVTAYDYMFINVYSIYFNPIYICSQTCLSHGDWQTSAVKTIPTAHCFSLLLLQHVQRASPQEHHGEKLEHIISTLHIAFFSPDVFIDRACSCCYMIFCFFLSTSIYYPPIYYEHFVFSSWY